MKKSALMFVIDEISGRERKGCDRENRGGGGVAKEMKWRYFAWIVEIMSGSGGVLYSHAVLRNLT